MARRYDVIDDKDIGVSVINAGLNLEVTGFNMISSSTLDVLGNQVSGINTLTSILFESPIDSDRFITAEIQLIREVSEDLDVRLVRPILKISDRFDIDVPVIDVFANTSEYISVVSGRVEDVISNSIITTGRQITSTISHEIDNTSISNINYFEVGAYLDVDLDAGDNIAYIPDTSKFKTNGYLLVGNEIVRYYRKLSDRFLNVQRGQNNTTEQSWSAGTFLRQIPDPVSIAYGGVTVVESESQVVTIPFGTADIKLSERERKIQIFTNASLSNVSKNIVTIVQPSLNVESITNVFFDRVTKFEPSFNIVPLASLLEDQLEVSVTAQVLVSEFNIKKETLEVLVTPPPSGVVDGYQESVFIADPIKTRLNGFVDIDDDYQVVRRDLSIVFVVNEIFGLFSEYIGNYAKTNVGPTIGNWYAIYDDGEANVSNLTIEQFTSYYPALSIRDFTDRKDSSYTLSGDYFNLANPSIQNPVAISSSTGTIGGSIIVQSTSYFPNSGYLISSTGTVIQYTSKTSTSFDNCTLYRGADLITSGDELIPYSIF